MKHKRILIVDDEPRLVRLVKVNLLASGYEVGVAADGKTAIAMLEASSYDLLILDIMLPAHSTVLMSVEKSGVFRYSYYYADRPGREQDRIRGFDVGADDYLTKPFSVEELLRRVRAVLRRTCQAGNVPKCPIYTTGDLVINTAQSGSS